MVEVIIINWKRPKNVAKIVDALLDQTVPCIITVYDCSPSEEFHLDNVTRSKVNRVFQSSFNNGGFNRYIPMAAYSSIYSFFIDDDVLPGRKCIETYLKSAKDHPNFGVLGQIGRTLSADNKYRPKNIRLSENFIETDFVIRGYFVKTRYLYNVLRFKWFLGYFETDFIEDDLLLCSSLKYYENLSCYLIPFNGDRETLVNKEELSDDYSLSSRTNHYYERTQFIKRIMFYGWKPLNETNKLKKENIL